MRFHPGKGPLGNFMQNAQEGAYVLHQQKQQAKMLESRQAQPLLPSKAQSPATGKLSRQPKPLAAIDKIWANHNVEHSGQQGMQIHVVFSVANLLGRTGTVAA
jgi:hypothetical protein